jgi:aspartyl-tRNA(Asn)/glutamyl-tRNA(Gln) amidotransferase subunit C
MITRDQVLHVAKLARLELTAAEAADLTAQLARILAYAQQLRELDSAPPPPAAAPSSASAPSEAAPSDPAPARPDEPGPTLAREEALRLAPATESGEYVVPPVLEGG